MANISDIGKGKTIKLDGKIYRIVDFQHVKPGKGGAFARTKIKNVETNQVVEKTFRDNDKFELARIEKRSYQYLYKDNNDYCFMDMETYEQITVDEKNIGDNVKWLKENMDCYIFFADNKIIDIEVPTFLELKIISTEKGLRGDTSTAGTKPAILEGNIKIEVPLFINQDDIIKIDTRDGKYIERIK